MTIKYTKEQLNKFDKDLLIELFLGMQGQMEELSRQTQALNDRMQLMMEQMVLFQKNRFGRSSEKMADSEQIRFMEVDGTIVFFNEAEAVCDLDAPEPCCSEGVYLLILFPSFMMISIFSLPGFFTTVKSSCVNTSVMFICITMATISATAKTIATSNRLTTTLSGSESSCTANLLFLRVGFMLPCFFRSVSVIRSPGY